MKYFHVNRLHYKERRRGGGLCPKVILPLSSKSSTAASVAALASHITLTHSLFTTEVEHEEGLLMMRRFQSMSKHVFLWKVQKLIMAKCKRQT